MELLEAKLSQTVLLAEIIRLKNELHEERRGHGWKAAMPTV
jgi:hypothetical protein